MNPPIFEEVKLTWNGQDFVIPPDRVMRAIALVEDHLTLGQLHVYAVSRTPPLAKLAAAFAVALRYAGANVSDEEVYSGMFTGLEVQKRAALAIGTLQALMIPPVHLRAAMGKAAAASAKAAGPSSRKPSKRRSDIGE